MQKVFSSSKDKKVSIFEVEIITGAPKGILVNDFIHALAHKEKEKALGVIAKVSEGNISIKTFISLVLEKIRIILLSKNAPSLSKELQEHVSEDDWKVLDLLTKEKDTHINSFVLLELIKAHDAIGRAYIETLPLELAVIEVCGQKV